MPKKKVVQALIALVGLILILVWIQGGFHSKIPGGTTPLPGQGQAVVKTVKAEPVRVSGEVTVSGTVVARDTARIAARIQGYVVELKVDAGDSVKKGDRLLKIDSKELVERENQALSALESAKADLIKASNDYERYKVLLEKESISKKDYDDVLARYEMARASEAGAKAAMEEAKTLLSYSVVTAPFDGVVGERNVNIGDLAGTGKTLLTVYKPETVELVAAVGEQYAPFLKEETPVTVDIPAANLKEQTVIREVVPQRDEKTRTITVKAPVSKAPGVGPGLYGTLTFDTRSSDVIVIPKSAVTVVGQLESVRVKEDGVLKIRHVKTGRTLADDKVEILSGLDPGEEVVIGK